MLQQPQVYLGYLPDLGYLENQAALVNQWFLVGQLCQCLPEDPECLLFQLLQLDPLLHLGLLHLRVPVVRVNQMNQNLPMVL